MEGLRRGATQLRFGRDARLSEVQALLDSSRPCMLRLDIVDGDPETVNKQQVGDGYSCLRQ